MKFDWGKGIAAVIIFFILGMGLMVYISVTKNIDLVTPNYYEKEIKYQEQIDKIKNTNELKQQLEIEYTRENLLFTFPPASGIIKGEISFYRPSDAKKDFRLPIELDKENRQDVRTENLQKGLWKVQVNWSMGGKEYFKEDKIMIQ
jgi:hypothetical protein